MNKKTRAKAIAIENDIAVQSTPLSGGSLVPMLVIGLVLTFAGMIAAKSATGGRRGCHGDRPGWFSGGLRSDSAAALAQADILQFGEYTGRDGLGDHHGRAQRVG
jgi:hypothetical protein